MGPSQIGYLLTYIEGVYVLSRALDFIYSPSNHTMNDRKNQMGENLLRSTTQDEKGLILTAILFYPIF